MIGSQVQHLDEKDFDATVGQGVTLVDYWAEWCGPCRMLGPVLEELAAELDGQATIAKVNVDESPALAAKAGVSAIPLLVLYRDGREVDRLVGVRPKADIERMVRSAL